MVSLLTATYATAYLFCKMARPDLQMPESSKFIFGEDERSAGPTVRESALALGLVSLPPLSGANAFPDQARERL